MEIRFAKLLMMVVAAVTFASGVEAASRNAATCSSADVQRAVDSSQNGDTVVVPAGNCTWGDQVSVVNKTVSLVGAGSGAGGTHIVYSGTDQHAFFFINVGNQTGYMEVSGFWLDKPATGVQLYSGFVQVYGPVGWKNFRYHHNRMTSANDRDWHIVVNYSIHGLIDHNVFEGRFGGLLIRGLSESDWTSPLTLGSADWLFVEDNTFNAVPAPSPYDGIQFGVNDLQHGGRVVFRNNVVNNAFFQTHDRMRTGYAAGHAYEIYNNQFVAQPGYAIHKGVELNSGTGVVYGNSFTGWFNYAIGMRDYKTAGPWVNNGTVNVLPCNGSDPLDQNVSGQSGWRCQYQVGTHNFGANTISYPVYFWSNTCDGDDGGCSGGSQPGIVDDSVTEAPYNRPTSSHVQPGRDYINNGTTPKPGYTPFAYPHPLQSGAGGSSSLGTPEPPRNLRITTG